MAELKAKFLAQKESEMRTGELTIRSFMSIVEVLNRFEKSVQGLVSDLTPEVFATYRNQLAAVYQGDRIWPFVA